VRQWVLSSRLINCLRDDHMNGLYHLSDRFTVTGLDIRADRHVYSPDYTCDHGDHLVAADVLTVREPIPRGGAYRLNPLLRCGRCRVPGIWKDQDLGLFVQLAESLGFHDL
jgi:hypothetical protein